MAAQTNMVVNDYLKEVRVFSSTSAEFSQAAAILGVSATLSTLGAGQSLVVAVRNDSGGPVELRILFQLAPKGGTARTRDLYMGYSLAAGEVTLVAPREINGTLAGLMHAGKPGVIVSGSPIEQPLNDYQGATATASIDSATLVDGKFIGADTQKVFDRLVAEHAAKKKFYSDLAGMSGQSQAAIEQALTTRKANADAAVRQMTDVTNLNLAANAESGLAAIASMRIQQFGMASLAEWVAQENATLDAKPALHK